MAILPVNRRQLLASIATIAVAGIAPNIPHTEDFAKSEIAEPTKALSLASAGAEPCKFDSITVLRLREIAQRNRIRLEAGLPLLSIAKELRRLKEAANIEKFRKFADANRKGVYDRMLARARRRCGNPDWAPTGVLSGGGMWFNIQVERQTRKLYRRIAFVG